MNPIEQQMKLARELMELNAQWFRKLAEFDSKNFNSYVQFNQDFAGKLPEVNDVQSFVELQREYGEQLWSNTQKALTTRGEMLRDAFEAHNEAIRKAFTPESEVQAEATTEDKKAAPAKAKAA